MRELLRAGVSGAMVLVIMLVGSVVLWVGVPIGWLWIGSQVQGSTGSIGTSLAVAMGGALVSIIALAAALGWLNHKHEQLAQARGVELKGSSALEKVLVVSAGLSVVLFSIWFLLFAGIGPTLAPQ
ncbi:MAG: hypothetical protein H0T15_06835 [Thermoleophilaceae bacterium]|nr:hypothetical protein [Thermoleophilaceae bacterium]